MMVFLLSLFLILHGLVHLLYLGQSRGAFALQPGMTWPAGAWVFTRLGAAGTARALASLGLAVAAAGFVAGGAALLLRLPAWRPLVLAAAGFSTLLFVLLWDGTGKDLDDQGGVGVLMNAALAAAALLLVWPGF